MAVTVKTWREFAVRLYGIDGGGGYWEAGRAKRAAIRLARRELRVEGGRFGSNGKYPRVEVRLLIHEPDSSTLIYQAHWDAGRIVVDEL